MNDPKTTWPTRRPMIIGIIGVIVLLGGFGTWAATAQIAGAVIAPGQIEVEQNRQVIQHPDGGVVMEIPVSEGDMVEAGDVLLRLDPADLQSRLSIVESQLFELIARRGRLEAERDGRSEIVFDDLILEAARTNPDAAELLDGQRQLLAARSISIAQEVEQLGKRRSQISDQIVGIDAQRRAITEQLGFLAEELRDQQSLLDRGLAQAARVLALQREQSRLDGTSGELLAQKAQAEGRITEIDLEILKLETRRREEAITRLRDLGFRELELREERRALMDRMDRLDLRAPVSGIIYGLRVFALRSVVRPADPVMFIIPQDRPLIINARVDPNDIDQLFLNQEVVMRFTAFEMRTTPELMGTVTRISADAFQDDATQMSFYRAQIVLNEGEQSKLPEGAVLIPGMPVETFIRTTDRTPIAYLTKPLTDYLTRAFRD